MYIAKVISLFISLQKKDVLFWQ